MAIHGSRFGGLIANVGGRAVGAGVGYMLGGPMGAIAGSVSGWPSLPNLSSASGSTATGLNVGASQQGFMTQVQRDTYGMNGAVDGDMRVNANGQLVKKSRRRRRRLLTCGDKADIAFLHGQLGGGQLGRAAISSLLSRRCG